ncbi:3-phenylpropionate-dihydrodiol/cinnamic acid-dihydrodiol dehydrogenase [Streptomyces sp. RB17]|uniref:SDR family oxidoreductase n=1 Tax=Streptomyces sp. RB17 TaxID=2585197 RepID=UPI001297B83E|nr:SDR family oxidoreductase [Streptomyces sp. RB17]MQY36792.1 3-phenylpropionate-dihydrodiol/cinnamic acid-dihydrodiol dehydrogenase [Streptomyces sp. RB17]
MSTWLVTGASSGIGRKVTEQLLRRGDHVAAVARRAERLDDLVKEYGDRIWTAPLDVTDTEALRDMVDRIFAELGRVDVVFSNAGSGAVGAAEELEDSTIEQQIALTMTAPIQLARAVIPRLRAQGGGRFIQTSTMGGQITTPGAGMYHASKWGVEGFMESVAPEVAPFGIGITMIQPGVVRTGFGSVLSIAPELDAYASTPVGQVRRYIQATGGNLTADATGDPEKAATAIINSADISPAPLRLALGSDSYGAIKRALEGRLAELERTKSIAFSTDFAR